jgi:hypothetical protein
MPLKAYEEIAPEPLAFPINGKLYVVPPVGFQTGLRLTEIIQAGPSVQTPETAEDLWRMILGPAYDEMKTDDVPGDALARAGFAALTDFQFGRDAAEAVWESGADPKALAAVMLDRAKPKTPAPAKRPASPRSRSTASGSRTKTASTRSTTSRKR